MDLKIIRAQQQYSALKNRNKVSMITLSLVKYGKNFFLSSNNFIIYDNI